jgi:hypothetical protein
MKALEVVLWFKTARFARFFEEDAVDNQGKQGLRVCILTDLNRCVLIERQYRSHDSRACCGRVGTIANW